MSSRGKNKKTSDNQSNGSVNKKRRSDKTVVNESGDTLDIFGERTVNSSKTHPALVRLSDASSPISISPRRKRSLLLNPKLIDEDGLELNDDEAEIREEKRQKELELQKEKEKVSAEKDSLSTLNFSILSRMTATELKEHVMQCVKLSTENKITTKNAFALQLIDCMAYMMKKDNSNSDFSTMACTLDASAKIYSHRVDSICNDMSKLVDAFLAARKRPAKKSKGDDQDDNNNEDDSPIIHRHRRNKKNPVLISEESLTAKPADKNFLRNYMKLEVGNGAFISTSVWNPSKKQPSLEKGILLLYSFEEQEEETCEVDINDFFSKEEIELALNAKEFSKDSIEKDNESNMGLGELFIEAEKANVLNKVPNNIIDVDPIQISEKNSNVDTDWEFHDDDDDDDIPVDDDSILEEPKPDSEEKINCVPDVIKQMEIDDNDIKNGHNLTRRTEKLQAMFDKGHCASEYSYLEQTYSPVWTGPDYWKKSYKGRLVGNAKKGGKKKKGPVPLMFDTSPTKDLKGSVPQKLSRKTMLNWKEKKVTVPEDLHIDPNLFLQLFFRPKDKSFLLKLGKSAGYMLSNDLDNSNAIDDTTTYSPDLMAITEDTKALQCEDNDDGIGSPCQPDNDSFGELSGQDEIHHTEEEATTSKVPNPDLLDGSNLIAAPKMVAIQHIKYATRPNKVNMKELKRTLYDILAFDCQNKENKGPLDESAKMKFSELYMKLSKTLPTANEEKITSPSMAFLALLHLANEHNFELQNPSGDNTDFMISPEI